MRRIFLTKRLLAATLSLSLAAGERRGFKNLLKTGAKRANFHTLCRQTFCQTFHTIFHKLVSNKPTDNKLACNQPVFNTPACNEVSVLLARKSAQRLTRKFLKTCKRQHFVNQIRFLQLFAPSSVCKTFYEFVKTKFDFTAAAKGKVKFGFDKI